jgi:hypothetical protein
MLHRILSRNIEHVSNVKLLSRGWIHVCSIRHNTVYGWQGLWRYCCCRRCCSACVIRRRTSVSWTVSRKSRRHTLCQWKIHMSSSSVFVRDLSRFVQKLHSPVFGAKQRYYMWRLIAPSIDEIELDSSFAFAITLATILTMGPCFVAFQVTFATGETSCPHTLRLAAFTTVVAIAGVHQISLGIRFGSDSFDFLVGLGARVMRWGLALGGCRRLRFWIGMVYSGCSRGARRQWVGICWIQVRLRIRRLIIVGSQGGQRKARRPGYAPLR